MTNLSYNYTARTKIKKENIDSSEENLVEARRKSDYASEGSRPNNFFGDLSPTFTDAGARDNVLAERPVFLASLHALYDLRQDLREHAGPGAVELGRTLAPTRHRPSGSILLGVANTSALLVEFLERLGELTREEGLPQRHRFGAASRAGAERERERDSERIFREMLRLGTIVNGKNGAQEKGFASVRDGS